MTKEILIQQALEFENIVVELLVISEFQFFPLTSKISGLQYSANYLS